MGKSTTFSRQYPLLTSQEISEDGPGSILIDFEMLLGFVEDGLPTSGKYHLLPMKRLAEIDQRMTNPLRPRLQRPQQRSFPHLNGLYLLLRATQLGVVEGSGTKASLVLNRVLHQQWLQLNPTERYFTLLEAWLRFARFEMIGEHDSWMQMVPYTALQLFAYLPPDGDRFVEKHRFLNRYIRSTECCCTLALYELFGLLEVRRAEPEPGKGWCVAAINHTAFGRELMQMVSNWVEQEALSHRKRTKKFGAWQAQLKPFFPEWNHNLKLEKPAFRDGVYYFKVSLGKPWRKIAIPASADLDTLAFSIINAFDFDGDHLYAFHFTARDGSRHRVDHPYDAEGEAQTDEMRVGDLPLSERQSMVFRYDFGADWRFNVQLDKIDSQATVITEPTIVESHGKAPREYGYAYDYDDEYDEEYDDDEE